MKLSKIFSSTAIFDNFYIHVKHAADILYIIWIIYTSCRIDYIINDILLYCWSNYENIKALNQPCQNIQELYK